MTKEQAEKLFKSTVLPDVIELYEKDGIKDKPARREAWNNFTDFLCKEGEITEEQYNTWDYPRWLE